MPEKKFLITLKTDSFQQKNYIKSQPTPEVSTERTKHKKSKLKLQQEFNNEIIADRKDINNEIFLKYFKYQNPLLLGKDLISTKQDKH